MVIINDFNIKKQADELGISVWKTPSFLFIVMGIVVMAAMTLVYFISRDKSSPELLILSEIIVVIVIMSIGNSVIQSVEQIAKVNKMKSDFISIVSHQLKTPPTEISWEIELLLAEYKGELNNKQLEIISSISEANRRIVKLTNDLLDVARFDQGRFILNKEKINIAEIIREVIQNNLIMAQANNVRIEFSNNGTIPEIIGDKKRIGVVVDNFLTNAIKYTKEKGKVGIEARQQGDNLVVSVKDNGVGIPESQKDKVFDKFFRSDNVVKYNTEGSGLGLYIAKKIIESSKGKIWFDTKEGQGSTFYFSLPIMTEA
ncbi:MAG: hypothetical protein A3J63_03270 [Candidatus Moranbacteria bacterium RIFCSPHIGHO2_02_FULL_40_12b]|nr:MAG: hypothetical protein A3J63_03270 [Candidatus Moranbacteria bacterium RIFCSPHIGHO2_02_FULL_40_12b]OGI22835.1 MAG: hypothetical protein A3E91_02135 [Candidatus Moranbacteria bacterium RIFCSPHIGHO2_12_FULL_40_10]OGM57597.1 MAG: hypothetical protein A3A50_01805 [Candidatus Woesebacteria bacterium RIFCSPLOWO2_01_FULL_38_20]